jgi:hypothetical protein
MFSFWKPSNRANPKLMWECQIGPVQFLSSQRDWSDSRLVEFFDLVIHILTQLGLGDALIRFRCFLRNFTDY